MEDFPFLHQRFISIKFLVHCFNLSVSMPLFAIMMSRGFESHHRLSAALHLAIREENEAMTSLFLQNGADLNATDAEGNTRTNERSYHISSISIVS